MIRGLVFVVCSLAAVAANAQQAVYRCGNSYSQSPCHAAKVIETDDARSAADVAEARRIAAREKQHADRLEQDRLVTEAMIKPALATGFNSRPSAPDPASHALKKHKSKKRHHAGRTDDDEDFVAIAPDSLKRKKPAK